MASSDELLAAGAYLPVKEKLKSETTVDPVSARVYRHPALGSRPVVRLTADNLAAGDDLTMEFLGFSAPEVIGPVAKRQRQSLGFPGWALINDPGHARYALELVKEFKKAVRKAKAKPGHGYDEFVEIAKRLGKGVAHFLPSFWEQVGREYIAFDNSTYASRAFGKAREAEKVHALKVDESIRQDAFLEFALAGAVSIKALTEYGKELSSTHDSKEAWEFFRELCVRRTLGGMPPWTSMAKDILPLLKAAKLNPEDEVHKILVEIIDSPSISRASMGFWDGVSKFVGSLVAKNHHVAGVLLNLIPKGSSWRENLLWQWLDLLDSWGVLANGWNERVPEEAMPAGGPAAWVSRLIADSQRPRQKLFDIIQAMAPRLRNDRVPVNPYQKYRWGNRFSADVDLLDLLLELKIPLIDPPPELELDLRQWARLDAQDKQAQNRPRDPVVLAADGRFTESLRESLTAVVGETDFETAAAGKEAMKEFRRAWLHSLIDGLTNGALPKLEESLDTIDEKASKAIFQEFPEALERLLSVDLLPAITRTLQNGIMDEYGWPALEKVCEEFAAAGHPKPSFYGHFPYLIATDNLKAVVLRGNQVVHEAELKIPAGNKLERLMYIDGDLLVWVEAKSYQSYCFWNNGAEASEVGYHYSYGEQVSGIVIDAPGGGTFVGEKIVHKDGKSLGSLQAVDHVYSDGSHWWIMSFEYDAQLGTSIPSFHEVDPVTGNKGRRSLPSFFENYIEEGWTLDFRELTLLPFGSIFPKSLLGSKDGLIGVRVRHDSTYLTQIEGVDGRSMSTPEPLGIKGILDQAATEKFLGVEPASGYRESAGFTLWDSTGEFAVAEVKSGIGGYNRGQAASVPWLFLHAYEVRDVVASKILRQISDSDVKALLDAERKDMEDFQSGTPKLSKTSQIINQVRKSSGGTAPTTLMSEAEHYPMLDAAIRKLIGEKSSPRLRTGLRAIIILAGKEIWRLKKVIERRTSTVVAKVSVKTNADDVHVRDFASFIKSQFHAVPSLSFIDSMAQLSDFFDGKASTVHLPPHWFEVAQAVLCQLPQKIWAAYCLNSSNRSWIPFAEKWCKAPIHGLRGSFRSYTGHSTSSDFLASEIAAVNAQEVLNSKFDGHQGWLIPYIGTSSRSLVFRYYGQYKVLEYSPDGKFESIPGLTETEGASQSESFPLWTAEQLATFIELVKSKPFQAPPGKLLKEVAEQVNASSSEVALVWLGLPNFDSYNENFLPAQFLATCKLKARECSTARKSLKVLSQSTLDSLVRSVLEGGPADLWEDPPVRVAERLQKSMGQLTTRLPVSPEWLKCLNDAIGYGVNKARVLQALNSPLADPMFGHKAKWFFQKTDDSRDGVLSCSEDESNAFTDDIFQVASFSIAMLACGLPVGDPARNKMCDVFRATQSALENPGLILEVGTIHEYEEAKRAKLKTLIESIVGKIQVLKGNSIADDGTLAAVLDGYTTQLFVRPATISTAAQLDRVAQQLISLTSEKSESNPFPEGHSALKLINSLRLFRSSEFSGIVDRIQNTPVAAGNFEVNPLHSIPEIVKQAMKRFKVSEDAAGYYLQLLTLADPTDKNIALWNGWNSALIRELSQQLIDKGLVLEATRARAGRKVFLPGGWEDLKAPHLPIETWKMPLFQLRRDWNQRATPPMSRIVPLEPVHQLFAKAWKRIIDGDVPKYDEVR